MRRLALTALLLAGCRADRPAPAAAATADAGPLVVDAGALLLRSRGGVELQRQGGEWVPATQGDRIRASDGLRTPLDGEADLSVDGVLVRLYDRSEIHLSAVRQGNLRGRVRGRIESEVQAGKGSITLQTDDGAATATSEGGHFFVTADGSGAVVVASTLGEVQVSAGGKQARVGPGQVTRVQRDSLDQPVEALRQVLLNVEWPGEKTNRATLPLSGRVAAGSRVYVQGAPVEVTPDGTFHADVKLHDGRQKLAVVTVDPLGRRAASEAQVTRDATPPRIELQRPRWK